LAGFDRIFCRDRRVFVAKNDILVSRN
jgi:hypothetical protein